MRCEGEEGVIRAKVYAGSMIKIAVLVVAFSAILVGMASAEEVDIDPVHQTIPYSPNDITYEVNVSDITDTDPHSISATIFRPEGNEWQNDLEFYFTYKDEAGNTLPGHNVQLNTSDNSGWLSSGSKWHWGDASGSFDDPAWQKLILKVRAVPEEAPQGQLYRFSIRDESEEDYACGTTAGTSIPEFMTIAIPLATTIGIAFFMFRRRASKKH